MSFFFFLKQHTYFIKTAWEPKLFLLRFEIGHILMSFTMKIMIKNNFWTLWLTLILFEKSTDSINSISIWLDPISFKRPAGVLYFLNFNAQLNKKDKLCTFHRLGNILTWRHMILELYERRYVEIYTIL